MSRGFQQNEAGEWEPFDDDLDAPGETFVTDHPDGSVSLDAYAGKTREELKQRCRELVQAVDCWQMIALHLHEYGRAGLSEDDLGKLDHLIEAYRD